MKRSLTLLGAALAVSFTACQREADVAKTNPTYNPETNSVKTSFVLNISTETGKDTKTTAEFVQADDTPFLGLDAAHLLTYKLDDSNKSAAHGYFLYTTRTKGKAAAAERDYDLGSLVPAGTLDRNNSSRVLELALPLGTNAVTFYAKALKTTSDDLQGKVDISGNSEDLSTLQFKLVPRLSSDAAFDAGAFFFSRMLTYFLLAGAVNENNFWEEKTGDADKSYKFWWPVPSAADATGLPANPYDQQTATVNGVDYKYYKGQLSWKQLGIMYQYESDESDATLSEDVVKTEGAPGVAPAAMRLSALGEVLGDAYAELTTIRKKGSLEELRAGSASAVLRISQDLYAIVERVVNAKPTGWEEYAAQFVAQDLKSRMDRYFTMNSGSLGYLRNNAGLLDVGTLKSRILENCPIADRNTYSSTLNTHFDDSYLTEAGNQGFPVNVGLPFGAAIMSIVPGSAINVIDRFVYNKDIPAYGLGQATFPIGNYRYPAELMYYGNSAIRVSDNVSIPDDYPQTPEQWKTNSNWPGWTANAAVSSTTRSVAMMNSINYGTALLASTVKFGDSVLNDNNAALHKGESDNVIPTTYVDPTQGFFVTGIIVGGQADVVDWCFVRKAGMIPGTNPSFDGSKFTGLDFTGNAFDKFIYDKVTTQYKVGSTTAPIYTMVWDNYDATKPANEQSDVYIGVEIKNMTDKDFWGEMNLVRRGGTFYLLGKLDLSTALAAAKAGAFDNLDRSDYCYPPFNPANGETINAPRVFMQDYMTKANLILGKDALKHAYVTVPDLRSSQVSLGLSIDMTWTPGLAFDVNMGVLE